MGERFDDDIKGVPLAVGQRIVVTKPESRFLGRKGTIVAFRDDAPDLHVLAGVHPAPPKCDVWGIQLDEPVEPPNFRALMGLRWACGREVEVVECLITNNA